MYGGDDQSEMADQENMISFLRQEVRKEYSERLDADCVHACNKVDQAVLNVLRQIPAHIRELPASKALHLLSDSPLLRVRPCEDASTQTAQSFVQSTRRLRTQAAESPKGSCVESDFGEDPAVRAREMQRRLQEMEEFKHILKDAPNRLQAMPLEQRASFLRNASESFERFAYETRLGGAAGASPDRGHAGEAGG